MYIWIYYGVGIAFSLMLICRACCGQSGSRRAGGQVRNDRLFLSLVVITLTFLRIPSLCFNEEMNADESQVIASAITLLRDPVYGHSVDGTTIGPLNSYILLLPHLLGLPMDYSSARLVALVLIAGSLVLFYRGLRRVAAPRASRISTLLLTLFFGWTSQYDFLHFSSELTSLLLINACFLVALPILTTGSLSLAALLEVGVLAGLTPYSKLQALPIVGMILFTITGFTIHTYRNRAIGPLLLCGAGFLLPTIFVFGLAGYFRVSDYFIHFYFISNLVTYNQLYADVPLVHQGVWQKLLAFPHFLGQYADIFLFVILPALVTIVSCLFINAERTGTRRVTDVFAWPMVLAILTALGAFGAVIVPGTEFGHHLLLLVFPVGWVTGLCLNRIFTGWAGQWTPARLRLTLLVGLPVICLGNLLLTDTGLRGYGIKGLGRLSEPFLPAAYEMRAAHQPVDLAGTNPCLAAFPTRMQVCVSPVAQIVGQYALPSDRLVVWGWHCSYYVETQLAQGVSEAHSQRSIVPNQMQAMYLKRYARELAENRPVVFLDAVGRNSLFLDRPNQHCEFYDEVQTVIRGKYTLIANVQDVRIYVRNNSLTEHRRVLLPTVQ